MFWKKRKGKKQFVSRGCLVKLRTLTRGSTLSFFGIANAVEGTRGHVIQEDKLFRHVRGRVQRKGGIRDLSR